MGLIWHPATCDCVIEFTGKTVDTSAVSRYIQKCSKHIKDANPAASALTLCQSLAASGSSAWQTSKETTCAQYDDFQTIGAFTVASEPYTWTQGQGRFRTVYRGNGTVQLLDDGAGTIALDQVPGNPANAGDTHACRTETTDTWVNFELSVDIKTVSQNRTGGVYSGATPNAWECGWIMWNYYDDFHHYYFIVKPGAGYEYGKKDNETHTEAQVFIKTGGSPTLTLNQWDTWVIRREGNNVKISVNGTQVVNFNDPSPSPNMLVGGKVCFYLEDAKVRYKNLRIRPIHKGLI